jgi:hypothetical protein
MSWAYALVASASAINVKPIIFVIAIASCF